MRVLLIPAHLFFLSLPITTLSSSNLDTGVQAEVNHAIAKSSDVDSWTWPPLAKIEGYTTFLNPSHIVENIKGALFSSDLDVTQTASVQPEALALLSDGSPSDFWDAVEKYQDTMQDYVPQLLNSAAVFFDSTKFTDIMSAMRDIVNATTAFHDSIQETLRAQGTTLDMLTEELDGVFTSIGTELAIRASPDEKALSCAELATKVDTILDNVAIELEPLFQRLGIEEGVATDYIRTAKPHIQTLVVAVCEINKQYPDLFPGLAFSVAVLLIPQGWILRPFLGLFGFGPAGPLRGSAAAWLQRYFWGAAVRSGSWFAWLQAAGMGTIPVWADVVAKVHLLVGGLFAMLFRAKGV